MNELSSFPASRLLDAECERLQGEHNLKYSDAVEIVSEESPGLVQAWDQAFGEKNPLKTYEYVLSELFEYRYKELKDKNGIAHEGILEKMKELNPYLYERYFSPEKQNDEDKVWEAIFNTTQLILAWTELLVRDENMTFEKAVERSIKDHPSIFDDIEKAKNPENKNDVVENLIKRIANTEYADGKLTFVLSSKPVSADIEFMKSSRGYLVNFSDVAPTLTKDRLVDLYCEMVDQNVQDYMKKRATSYSRAFEFLRNEKPGLFNFFKFEIN